MADVSRKMFDLAVHFPQYFSDPLEYILQVKESNYAFICESIHTLIVVTKPSDTPATDFKTWKDYVKSLILDFRVAADSDPAEIVSLSDKSLFLHGQHKERHKESLTRAASQHDKFFQCSPLNNFKENQSQEWIEIDEKTLVYPIYCKLEPTEKVATSAMVWVSLWSAAEEDLHSSVTASLVKSFSTQHPEVIVKHRDNQLVHLVHRQLPVLYPPITYLRHIPSAGSHTILIKVSNHHNSILILHETNVNYIGDSDLEDDGILKIQPAGHLELPVRMYPKESHVIAFNVSFTETFEPGCSLEVKFRCSLKWSVPKMARVMITNYCLPSFVLRKPSMLITAAPREIKSNNSVVVNFTIDNKLQDFSCMKLVWNAGRPAQNIKAASCNKEVDMSRELWQSVVCHKPVTNLGACMLGSVTSVDVGFQILNPGVFELGRHMKLHIECSQNANARERRGSITSTRSMPVDSMYTRYHEGYPLPLKSSSMSPVIAMHHSSHTPDSNKDGLLPPSNVPQNIRSVPSSPSHYSKRFLPGNNNNIKTTASTISSPTMSRTQYHASINEPKVSRSRSQCSSHSNVSGITAQQVLKRNCQVYVLP